MNVGAVIGANKVNGIVGRRAIITPPLDSGSVQSQN